jgi:catechol 2,3-dioxygenase-like lactoylglutathione lyase family enzyme
MDAMLEFYTKAFGFTFEPHDTYGLASQFGYRDGLTLKFVPIRDPDGNTIELYGPRPATSP